MILCSHSIFMLALRFCSSSIKLLDQLHPMKTVYLHVGYHKTGTTAIQGLLTLNAERLAEHGVLYPQSCLIQNTPDLSKTEALAHHRLPLALLEGNSKQPDELRAEIDASECARFIISSEVFMERFKENEKSVAALVRLLEGLETRVVIYLRPQYSLLESVFNQQIKDSAVAPPFNPSRLPPYFDYLKWVQLWGAQFGDDHIIVRPYERAQFANGDLYSDFIDAVGGGVILSDLEVPASGANPRLSRNALFFKRIINGLDVDARTKRACNGPLLRYSAEVEAGAGAFQDHGLLTFAERAEIARCYEDRNAQIARDYLGRADGRLFLSTPRQENNGADSTSALAELSPQVAGEIADLLVSELRPDLDEHARHEALAHEIVRGAIALIEPTDPDATDSADMLEALQKLVRWQQNALHALRVRHAETLTEIALMKGNASEPE